MKKPKKKRKREASEKLIRQFVGEMKAYTRMWSLQKSQLSKRLSENPNKKGNRNEKIYKSPWMGNCTATK